jgi:(2R)-ethylmalonyl-CoA mutase
MDRVQAMGGAIAAVESGYMKSELVSPRTLLAGQRIEAGDEIVVGVNKFDHDRATAADRRPRRRDPDCDPEAEGGS